MADLTPFPGITVADAAYDMSLSDSEGHASLALGDSVAVEMLQIEGDIAMELEDFWDLIAEILGTVQVSGDGLARTAPLRHSLLPNLYAERITEITGIGSFVENNDQKYPTYGLLRIGVAFTARPYTVVGGAGVGDESTRWTVMLPKPYTEAITAGVPFYYTGTPFGLFDKTPAPGKRGIYLDKRLDLWTHYEVPYNAIVDANGNPTNLAQLIGRVNSDTYKERVAGTYFCKEASLELIKAPLTPDFYGLPDGAPPILCILSYACIYFDKGWQKLPGPGWNWYTVTTKPDGTGNKMYAEAAFGDLMFKSI